MASSDNDRTVGALLRGFRHAAGISQQELAERAGLSVEAIGAIERGTRRRPHPHTLRALASALSLPEADRASLFEAAAEPGGPDLGPASAPDSGLLPAAPQVRYSLPADTVAFTGRGGELDQIMTAGAAGAGGVVAVGAVAGMPGVGKTALTVHAAHVLAGEFPDRQLFIDLHAHTPGHEPVRPQDALAGLLAVVGVEPRHLPSDLAGRAALWRDQMAGQRALLVLDNAASSDQVAPLLPGSGGCLVLVTSRRHLGDLPVAVTRILVDVLTPQEAADMFTRLAPRAASDCAGVAEVVALAGYLPLAVCLLARVFERHVSWTLADLVGEARCGVLALTAEHDSVAAMFELSYRHLDADSQRLFRLLGVCPGTVIDEYAAAALAGIRREEAARLLDGLHWEGLVTEAGYRRYGTHDLLRSYARDLAADNPTAAAQALERLLDYYQCAAAVASRRLTRQARPNATPWAAPACEVPALTDASRALAWIRDERASLLACLDLSAGTGQHFRVVALTASVAGLLTRDGPWAEAVTRHTTAIDAARQLGDRLGEANALTDLGDTRRLMDDYQGAAGYLARALDIYHDLGDRLGEANTLSYLGDVRRLIDDYQGAAENLEQALDIYHDLGDRHGEANVRYHLGTVRQATGDHQGAARSIATALDIYRDLGNRLGEANALNRLGMMRQATGDYPGAAQVLEGALAIYRDLGSRLGEANALYNLGTMRQATGDHQGAADAVEAALGIYRDLGDRQGESAALDERGTLYRASGDLDRAQRCHQQALDLARAIGSSHDEAQALAGLGRCARATGSIAEATLLLRQAHEIFQRIGAAETSDVRAELYALAPPESSR